jgi:hypothetical protein
MGKQVQALKRYAAQARRTEAAIGKSLNLIDKEMKEQISIELESK